MAEKQLWLPDKVKGCGTALITPFNTEGTYDDESLRDLVAQQIAGGASFLVVNGTTGESPTNEFGPEVLGQILPSVIELANGKNPVVLGVGYNDTYDVVDKIGAISNYKKPDALLVVAPYYNKPNQAGLFEHYKIVCGAATRAGLPVIGYNVPGRTGVNLEPETVARLAQEVEGFAGLKEAGDQQQIARVLESGVPDEFKIFTGEDGAQAQARELGAVGVISVVSHLIPQETTALWQLDSDWRKRELEATYTNSYRDLIKTLFNGHFGGSPAVIKYALAKMGIIASDTVRPPLVGVGRSAEYDQADYEGEVLGTLINVQLIPRPT